MAEPLWAAKGVIGSAIGVRIPLGELAACLTAMCLWLSEHGCVNHVIHCRKAGCEVELQLEFDQTPSGVSEAFRRAFG